MRSRPGIRWNTTWLTALFLIATADGIAGSPADDPDPGDEQAPVEIIAYLSEAAGYPYQVWTMGPDGSNKTQLTFDDQFVITLAPDVSPDGSQVLFSAVADAGYDVFTVPIEGGEPVRLTEDQSQDVWASWSPDGSRIAYSRDVEGEIELFVLELDSGAIAQVTDLVEELTGVDLGPQPTQVTSTPGEDEFAAQWSPDGTRLAYAVQPHVGNDHVRILDLESGVATDVTTGTLVNATMPEWSPDGTRLVVVATDGNGRSNLFTIDPDGTDATQVTFNDFVFFPAWSPGGDRMVFSGPSLTGIDVFSIAVDGSDQVQLTTEPGLDFMASWGAIAPEPSAVEGLVDLVGNPGGL